MTILELEQGLRNLVASQPNIMQSVNGPIVNSIMGLIDSTKNMIYRIQTYPAQDAFKFSMTAEVQRLEASITSLAVQNLQARGINLMLYIPQDSQFAQFVGQYGPYPNAVEKNMYGTQMAYIPNTAPVTNMSMPEDFEKMPKQSGSRQSRSKASAEDTIPKATASYGKSEKKIDIVVNKIKSAKNKQESGKVAPAVESEKPKKSASVTEPSSEEENMPEESSEEVETGEPSPKRPSSSAGRDYLLELLKK